MKKEIKFIDLFAGIGGFHEALKKVSDKVKTFDPKLVMVCEIDEKAIETYTTNFNFDKSKIKNIREVKDADVPDHDFLFAGFPCQTFSNAGKKLGFLDEIRGTLFFEIVRILKSKKPKYILLENVKHLVNHDNHKTWILINQKLRQLGYKIPEKPLILSPDQFGIPQDRKRVFIPGILDDSFIENSEELPDFLNLDFKDDFKIMKKDSFLKIIDTKESEIDEKFYINDSKIIKAIDAWGEFLINVKKPDGRTLPVIWVDEMISSEIINVKFPNWKKKYIKDMRMVYANNKNYIDKWIQKYDVMSFGKREKKFEWHAGVNENDITNSFIQLRQSGIRCRKMEKFPTLVAMVQIPIIFDKNSNRWRHLTPRETGRLQSFSDNFKIFGEIETNFKNKDFFSYKQFGNSVNVKVVSIIQEKLLSQD